MPRDVVTTSGIEGKLRGQADRFRKLSWPILAVSLIVTAGLVADLSLRNTPTFHTDLSDFAPESDSADAHERISKHFSNETRPMFVHVTRDDGGNVLDIDTLHEMDEHLAFVKGEEISQQNFVQSWITAPSLLQTALDEEAGGIELSEVTSWQQMIELVIDINETDCPGDVSKQREVAQFVLDGMLNVDFDGTEICLYIQSDGEQGSAAMVSSSTLWILEIDPNLSSEDRKVKAP